MAALTVELLWYYSLEDYCVALNHAFTSYCLEEHFMSANCYDSDSRSGEPEAGYVWCLHVARRTSVEWQ